ncbi:hypothetical protein KM176_19105 [Pseudooceanicola sp. CBS1P-1]|uniref:Histidine kinase/HSP90-like ATPase domain-containing protein n=1 Tax=Pseudooceanicola albus TaxID=2692189 RepID=A0A6L7G6A9_9RHOB|nr:MULTISPECIES: ATP-binding protein [Pseudooceanicola]MBT9385988.1 hypothetical protein [Pseudooceanicola endophyticus]MXN19591.1 hypothetical protein [Pseudooceanicola albus]
MPGGWTSWVFVTLWVGLLSALMLWLTPGALHPVPGTLMIREMELCQSADCRDATPIHLPYYTPYHYDDAPEIHHLRTTIHLSAVPDRLQSVYLPKLSDDVEIRLNGALVSQPLPYRRLWNQPLLAQISPELMHRGDNDLQITLIGGIPGRLDLHEVYFGPVDVLRPLYRVRIMMGPGFSLFGLGMMILLTLGFGMIWIRRPGDRKQLWLALCCASACIFLAQFGTNLPVGPYRIWKVLQITSLSAYALFMLKFLRCLLEVPRLWLEWLHAWLLGLGVVVMLLLPLRWIDIAATPLMFQIILTCLVSVVLLHRHRDRLAKADYRVFFLALSLSLTFSLDGLFRWLLPSPPGSIHLLHLIPLLTTVVGLWLIVSQLIRSLSAYEALTADLQDRIAEKSRKLEESFALQARAERQGAVQAERNRIMLDLHDGLGGQIVSTMAYLENNDIRDSTLRDALEDMLRDLALMLDCIENDESLTTLLGMQRTRLEGLLDRHGLRFDWQIGEEPDFGDHDPSRNLQIARIVQEAITNVVKHAGASVITIYTDQRQIRICDDGRGFDPGDLPAPESPHYGIQGMRRRAERIGARLSIRSSEQGTAVSVVFRPAPPASAAPA